MVRFKQFVSAAAVALVGGGLLVTSAFAWPGAFEGQPENLQPGGDLGYYVWHDDSGLHVRTTGPGPRHLFDAAIQTGGEIRDVRLAQLEGDDGFVVTDGGHVLHLHFETWNHLDGVDFNIEGGDAMRLVLHRDGGLVPTSEIFLGDDGHHPDNNPFFVPR
jgi:hypothetical protein